LSDKSLNLDGLLKGLLALLNAGLGLVAHDTATPALAGILVLLKVTLLDGRDELGELGLVLRADLGDGEDSSGLVAENVSHTACYRWRIPCGRNTNLLVNDSSETSLALDDGVRDTHLAAESGKEDDELNGVDIVGDEDERSLLVLNQANDVVETVLDNVGLLGDGLLLLALLDGGSLPEETLLLLGLGLRAVLVEELEGLGSGVLVKNLLELGDRRRDLQPHVEDLLLALEADILRPLHHTRKVALGLDILADTEVLGTLLDQRVLFLRHHVSMSGENPAKCGLLGVEVGEEQVTHLGGLLASLRLGEGGRSGLLAGLGGLH
jgi:hypothetical protein